MFVFHSKRHVDQCGFLFKHDTQYTAAGKCFPDSHSQRTAAIVQRFPPAYYIRGCKKQLDSGRRPTEYNKTDQVYDYKQHDNKKPFRKRDRLIRFAAGTIDQRPPCKLPDRKYTSADYCLLYSGIVISLCRCKAIKTVMKANRISAIGCA